MVWINALIASGGGQIIENAEPGRPGHPVDGLAGRRTQAADVIGRLAALVGRAVRPRRPPVRRRPARSSRATDGSFMVNWPYVYSAATTAVADGAARPVRASTTSAGPATREVDAGHDSAPAPRWHRPRHRRLHAATPTQALAAVKCITSVENNAQYMVDSGNPAARAAAYDDPAVQEAFPMADLIRDSIDGAGPRPITPVLRRRVGLGAAHLAPAGRRRGPQTRRRRPTRT